jgi:hypothetical protein
MHHLYGYVRALGHRAVDDPVEEHHAQSLGDLGADHDDVRRVRQAE